MRKTLLLCAMIVLAAGLAYAKGHLPEERGKKLFNDPMFAGGSKSCSTCHPDGKGIKKSAAEGKNLEEIVNRCIVNGNGGRPIPRDSAQMKDIISYIKSLHGLAQTEPPARPPLPPKGRR